MEKVIWLLWLQGWRNAPRVVNECADTWIARNRNWKVHLLEYRDIEQIISDEILQKSRTAEREHILLSDVIRINYLQQYGGVWADATLWCQEPLDNWLDSVLSSGFFAFDRPGPDRMISSWFLASEKGNPLTGIYCKAVEALWQEIVDPDALEYFWFHYLFEELFTKDPDFRAVWDATPKISADGPHLLQGIGLQQHGVSIGEVFRKNPDVPVYKLSWKIDRSESASETLLDQLYGTTTFPEKAYSAAYRLLARQRFRYRPKIQGL